ncbi:MAG: MnhB domain-containing protein [Rubrobacteraceae bacterium]
MNTVMTRTVARLLFLPTLMTALAVLVKGYADVGDGFNAGVIASLGFLLQYVAFGYEEAKEKLRTRYLPAIGFCGGLILALLTAFAPLFLGEPIFRHFPDPGADVIHVGSLELITAVAFDVGVFLLVFGFAVGSIDIVARATEQTDRQNGEEFGA